MRVPHKCVCNMWRVLRCENFHLFNFSDAAAYNNGPNMVALLNGQKESIIIPKLFQFGRNGEDLCTVDVLRGNLFENANRIGWIRGYFSTISGQVFVIFDLEGVEIHCCRLWIIISCRTQHGKMFSPPRNGCSEEADQTHQHHVQLGRRSST